MHRLMIFALSMLIAAVASAVQAAAPAADSKARVQALNQFQADLVSVLALRGSAQPLLGAALLARPLHTLPEAIDFHHMITRAVAAPDAGPAGYWAQLADCDAEAGACPNPAALDQLRQQAPDNAAVWLLAMGQAARDNDDDNVREALLKASTARLYDDYAGASMQALASVVGTLPPPAAVLGEGAPTNAAAVQVMIVFGIASAQPRPALQLAARQCDPALDGDPALREPCLALAHTLEWGSSPLARSLGLHLRETLAAEPAQQQQARSARRDLVWQVENHTRLVARAQTEPRVAARLLKLARDGGTEMSLMLAALHAFDIPVQAPATWQPGSAQESPG